MEQQPITQRAENVLERKTVLPAKIVSTASTVLKIEVNVACVNNLIHLNESVHSKKKKGYGRIPFI